MLYLVTSRNALDLDRMGLKVLAGAVGPSRCAWLVEEPGEEALARLAGKKAEVGRVQEEYLDRQYIEDVRKG